MLRRIQRLTSLIVLSGAAALVGCASVQSTQEYAASHNWRPVVAQGTEYFCRREQPEVAGSPWAGVKCVTRRELLALKTTDDYAAAHGYRSVVINHTQYYCRGRDVIPGSLPNEAGCLTRTAMRARLSQGELLAYGPSPNPMQGLVPTPHALNEIALGLWR